MDKQAIIAEPFRQDAARRVFWWTLVLAGGIGCAAAVWVASEGLTLSHYDARAHLVVARRVIDSLTPGWRQLGAVWLPLPHVLQVLPTQWDPLYRSGAAGVALSVAALAWGLACLARMVTRRTGSIAAALTGPALVASNPNILFLQSTPMTEPLLFGLSLVALDQVDRWIAGGDSRPARRRAGLALVALMMTRYEGWFIAGALGVVAAGATWRRGWRSGAALLGWVATGVAGFLLFSKITVGAWFVSSGFFVPDNPVRGQPLAVIEQLLAISASLSSVLLLAAGGAGAVVCIFRSRRGAEHALPLTLAAAAALPFLAFYDGHPTRVRYLAVLVVAAAALASYAVATMPSRWRAVAAAALVAACVWLQPLGTLETPLIHEARWDEGPRVDRQVVTDVLREEWNGTPILASMGSLAHYMQDASAIGLRVRDFLHEGNFYLWDAAMSVPARHVEWILIEERAEGGDVLASRARESPAFLAAFTRVAAGGGVALYRRHAR